MAAPIIAHHIPSMACYPRQLSRYPSRMHSGYYMRRTAIATATLLRVMAYSMRYGYRGMPHHYGYRAHMLRRYY